jgi:hypothetical protein
MYQCSFQGVVIDIGRYLYSNIIHLNNYIFQFIKSQVWISNYKNIFVFENIKYKYYENCKARNG